MWIPADTATQVCPGQSHHLDGQGGRRAELLSSMMSGISKSLVETAEGLAITSLYHPLQGYVPGHWG